MTVTLELLFPHLDELIQTPADVQRLNEAILQLAVQGKLVPQDPQDEPAGELLKWIDLERNRLVIEGQVDKVRKLSPVGKADFAFALPSGWSLVRLGELVSKLGAGSTPLGGKAVYQDQGIKFIRSQNVWNDGLHLDDVAFISEEINERMANTIVKPKDILLNITGASIGRSAIVPDDFDLANVSQHVAIVRLIQPELRQFLHICIVSPYTQNLITDAEVGISREGLSMSNLQHFVIPLPPLAEQKRIVAKVDELFAQTRALEAKLRRAQEAIVVVNRAVLHHLHQAADNATFQHAAQILGDHFDLLYTDPRPVTDLRQTILQLAVQGKLVPQDLHDEPAGELLKRIGKEKERLLENGEIKKEKLLQVVSDDDAPFEAPKGWSWTRIGNIATIRGGKRVPAGYPLLETPTPYVYIRVSDMKNGTIDDSDLRYLSEDIYRKIAQYIIEKDELYLVIVGSTIGKHGTVPEKFHRMNVTIQL